MRIVCGSSVPARMIEHLNTYTLEGALAIQKSLKRFKFEKYSLSTLAKFARIAILQYQ